MLITDYSFDVSAKTITLPGQNLAAERIMSIVNRTREIFYFRVGDSTKAISVAFDGTDTVISLNEDLSYVSHADTDLIQIIVTDTANLSDLIIGGELKVVDDGVAAIGDLIPEFLFVDGKLFVTTDLDLSGLATKAKQDDLIAKLPNGLTVIDGKLQTKPDIQFPSSYELGETSLAALENITAEIDKTGLATDTNQEATNTKLDTISDKIPTFTFDGTQLTVKTELTQPLTLTELQGITVNVSEQSPLDLSGLATKSKQDDLIAKLPNGLTVVGDRLKIDNPVDEISINNYSALISALESAILQAQITNNVSVISDDLTLDKAGLATDTNQVTTNTQIGGVTETSPSTDTASSGLNGRLQRIAQRITSLIGLFPTSLGAKTAASSFAVTLATDGAGVTALNSLDTKTPTVGQKTSAGSSPVVIASDQSPVPVSGTFFPPTQPVSLTSLPAFASPPTVNLGTIADVATQTTLSLLNAKIPSPLVQPLTQAQLIAQNLGVTVSNFPSESDPTQYINVRQTDGDQFSTPRLTKFSESLTAHNISVLNYKPTWGASDLRYRKTITGTGASIAESAGELVLQTGTTSTGIASLETLQRGQYQAGQQGQFGMGVRLSSLPTGSQFAEWGYFDEQNGFGFGVDATSLYTFSLFNGVKTKVYRANWSKDKLDGSGASGLTLDVTQGIVCHVDFIWYGYGDIDFGFLVYNPVTQHTQYIIANDLKINGSVSTCDPNQPLRMVVNNGGSTSSNFSLCVGGHQFSVIGGETQPKRRHLGEFINDYQLVNNTNWQPVLAIRRKSVFGDSGRTNSVKCFLRSLSVSASGADIKWKLSQNAITNNVTVAYATPTEWLAAETAVETKKTGATAITTTTIGYPVLYLSTAAGENVERIFEFDLDLTIDSTNEWVLYAQRTTGTATIRSAAIHWVEEW